MCVAEEKVSKQHKRWAACVGHLMSRAIGIKVPTVTIFYGDALRQTKVKTADTAYKAVSTCVELLKLMTAGDPPKLRLNGHCNACAFQRRCHAQAEKNDDLSLMQAISEREVARLNAKGIFTVAQYSYTYRPRRRREGAPAKPGKHNLALQALAKRTDTIYVAQRPELPPADTSIYLDLEGVPDRNFYYLLGMRIVSNGQTSMRNFWADSQVGERALWDGFIRTLMPLSHYVVFHYGAYDSRALRTLAKRYGDDAELNQEIQIACFNVLSSIHGHVHFPTLSNGLKAVAGVLGFSWSELDASGIQSLAWRLAWEERRDPGLKKRLITYNAEDCGALELVTQNLRDLTHADASKATLSLPVAMEESLSAARDHVRLLRKTAAFPELVRINECSYYTYQRDRVEIRTSSTVRKKFGRERRKDRHCLRVDRRVILTGDGVYTPKHTRESKQSPKKEGRLMTTCPSCGGSKVLKHGRRTTVTYDLKIAKGAIRRSVTRYFANRYRCQSCWKAFTPEEFKAVAGRRYGLALSSWVSYRNVALGQSLGSLEHELRDVFALSLNRTALHRFKRETAERCRSAYEWLEDRVRASDVIHADETKAKMKNGGGYVWVFANSNIVYYVHAQTREGELLDQVLRGFKGVLVSDFYAAYDSVDCSQQKCLIHLIRDINDDVFKNPFDEELKSFARNLTDIMAPIIETIDRFGLKKRNLGKHVITARRFCTSLEKSVFQSELVRGYQRRIAKYGDRMFTFLRHDGVSWNNNSAEHAIKRYAILRRGFGGMANSKGIGEYAVLLSISETLRRHGANPLEFLLTEDVDLERFLQRLR
jgi:predicted RecB family nuclease